MASQINPAAIDTTYPVAGINNNTQTFRDNWAAIAQNFTDAAREINDLQNKAVVTAPLTYGPPTISNNMPGQPLNGPVLSDFSYAIASHGTLIATNSETFDFTAGYWHTVTLDGINATISLTPANVPTTGYSQIKIQCTVSNTTTNFSLAALGTINPSSAAGLNITTKNLQFSTVGTYLITLGSIAGAAWDVSVEFYAPVARNYTPTTQIGALGDTAGQLAYDATYIYICIANYDGVTNIWRRLALGW